jgi:hypothetical protein
MNPEFAPPPDYMRREVEVTREDELVREYNRREAEALRIAREDAARKADA